MIKYDESFKRSVADTYLSSEGSSYLSVLKKLDIPNATNERKWVDIFNTYDKDSLIGKNLVKFILLLRFFLCN